MQHDGTDRNLMEIRFPGGMAVSATFRGHRVLTDQPVRAGGGATGPPPFDLFLASIGTCVGLYALSFCQKRDIGTAGLGVTLEPIRDPAGGRIGSLRIRLTLPPGFPDKYRQAILRAVNQCAVKRHILEPPEFDVALAETVAEPESGAPAGGLRE